MKKQVLGIVTMLTLVLMLTAASVHAQSTRTRINIPFSFTVGQETLPAGEYTVEPLRRDSNTTWLLQSKTGNHGVIVITSAGRESRTEDTRLVFHKYDNEYFLSQIWTPTVSVSRELPVRRTEREIASNGIERETVSVTAGVGK